MLLKIIEGISTLILPIFFDKFVKTELNKYSKLSIMLVVPVIITSIYLYETKYGKDEKEETPQASVIVNYSNGVRSDRPVKDYDIESLFKDNTHCVDDNTSCEDNAFKSDEPTEACIEDKDSISKHLDIKSSSTITQTDIDKLKIYDEKIAIINKDIKNISKIIDNDVQDYKISVKILMAQLKLNRDELDRSLSAIRKETDNSLQVIATVTNMSLNRVNEQSKNISKLMNKVNEQLKLFSTRVNDIEYGLNSLSRVSVLTPFPCPKGFIDLIYDENFDEDILGDMTREELNNMRGKLLSIGDEAIQYAVNGEVQDSVELHLCLKEPIKK